MKTKPNITLNLNNSTKEMPWIGLEPNVVLVTTFSILILQKETNIGQRKWREKNGFISIESYI